MNQKLKKTIEKQLISLKNSLENITNWQIESDEELWDYDHYSDLLTELEKAVNLLKQDEGLLENLEIWKNNNNDDDE